MVYEELQGTDVKPAVTQILGLMRGRSGEPSAAYGIAALELLRQELGMGSYGETLDAVSVGAFPPFVPDYLRHSLATSGIGDDEHIEGVGEGPVRAIVAFGHAGSTSQARETTTSIRLSKLATILLEIKPGDRVADYCCGQGIFLSFVASHVDGVTCVGFEKDADFAAVAVLRAHALGLDDTIEVRCEDVFGIPDSGERFNKVFSNYPIGMRVPRVREAGVWLKDVASGGRPYGKPVSFDWVYNQLLVDTLTEGGMAAAVVGEGALSNLSDEAVRKHFIENGIVAAVIALPIDATQGMQASLVVFGRCLTQSFGRWDPENPDADLDDVELSAVYFMDASSPIDVAVRMQDGTKDFPYTRHALDDGSIYELASNVVEDLDRLDDWGLLTGVTTYVGGSGSTISYSLIEHSHHRLSARYYEDSDFPTGWYYLDSYISSIGRGVTLKASELEAMTVAYDSGIRYLPPTGISDGAIDVEGLPFLAELTPKLEKHVVRDRDFLISRIGSPYRFCVAKVDADECIVASANLFVVRLSEELDPYYLAAYLSSPMGQRELELASSGSGVPSISANALRELRIDPDEAKVDKISRQYAEKIAEIQDLKARLRQAREDITGILEERGQ